MISLAFIARSKNIIKFKPWHCLILGDKDLKKFSRAHTLDLQPMVNLLHSKIFAPHKTRKND